MLTEEKRSRHRAYMRRRYQSDPEHRRKHKARVAVRKALIRGTIEKGPCEGCGDSNSQAHHDDYEKPLIVRWLCRNCHEAEHGSPNFHGGPSPGTRPVWIVERRSSTAAVAEVSERPGSGE